MKVVVENRPEERDYPWLGVGKETGVIVSFSEEGVGVVLKGAGSFPSGWFSKTWNETFFTPLNGTVTLSND